MCGYSTALYCTALHCTAVTPYTSLYVTAMQCYYYIFFVTVKAFPADTPSIASGNKLPEQLMSHVSTKNIYTGTLSATIHSRFVVC